MCIFQGYQVSIALGSIGSFILHTLCRIKVGVTLPLLVSLSTRPSYRHVVALFNLPPNLAHLQTPTGEFPCRTELRTVSLSKVAGLNIWEIGLSVPCIIYIRTSEDRYGEEDKNVRQLSYSLKKTKTNIISKLTVVVRHCLSTLIFIILAFFSESEATTLTPTSIQGKPGLI